MRAIRNMLGWLIATLSFRQIIPIRTMDDTDLRWLFVNASWVERFNHGRWLFLHVGWMRRQLADYRKRSEALRLARPDETKETK